MHKLPDSIIQQYKENPKMLDNRFLLAELNFEDRIEHRVDKEILRQKFRSMWDECLTTWVFPDEEDFIALL